MGGLWLQIGGVRRNGADRLRGWGWAMVAAVVLAAILPQSARAKAGSMYIEEMYWAADLVAVGRTTGVSNEGSWQIATLELERVIKGRALSGAVRYLASPTWTCDVSSALPGERVLILLGTVTPQAAEAWADNDSRRAVAPTGTADDPVYWIVHSGRGRMQVEPHAGRQRVTIPPEVVLPETLRPRTPAPRREWADEHDWYGERVSLVELLAYLGGLPVTEPTPTPTVEKGPLSVDDLRP